MWRLCGIKSRFVGSNIIFKKVFCFCLKEFKVFSASRCQVFSNLTIFEMAKACMHSRKGKKYFYKINNRSGISFKMPWASLSFSNRISNINWKSMDVVLGNWTRGLTIVGADRSAELWWPPNKNTIQWPMLFFKFLRSYITTIESKYWQIWVSPL